jgi:hypothetical protein
MPSKPNTLPADYVPEPEDPILSAEALKLAKGMDPEQLCHFLKIIDGFIEKGGNEEGLSRGASIGELLGDEEVLPRGVGVGELLNVRDAIGKIIIDKISGVIDLGDHRKPAKQRKEPTGELGKVLEFPTKSMPKPPKAAKAMPVKRATERAYGHLRLVK